MNNYFLSKAIFVCILISMFPLQIVAAENPGIVSNAPTIPSPAAYKHDESPAKLKKYTAGWIICNKSESSVIRVAFAYYYGLVWFKEGWRTIKRNHCYQVLTRLDNRTVYYYAEGEAGRWEGDTLLCVEPFNNFIHKHRGCYPSPSFKLYGYIEVNTGGHRLFTTNLVQ